MIKLCDVCRQPTKEPHICRKCSDIREFGYPSFQSYYLAVLEDVKELQAQNK